MAAPGSTTTQSGRGRTVLIVVAVGVGLVLLGIVGTSTPNSGIALDVDSTDPDGAKALAELVESFKTDVSVTDQQPPTNADVAIALSPAISPERITEIREWVRSGHRLVLVRPVEGLTPRDASRDLLTASDPGGFGEPTVIAQGACDGDVFDGVDNLAVDASMSFTGLPWVWEVPGGATSCFGDGAEAFAVVEEIGAGEIISLGTPYVFTNSVLDEQDNAVLATALLAPEPGTSVAVLEFPLGEEPPSGVLTVLRPGIKLAMVQGALAVVALGFARGRRLGRPIEEPMPTQIAGSELVSAVGNLLAQRKDPNQAAIALRTELVCALAKRFGARVDDPVVLAEVVSARTPVDRDRLLAVLAGPAITDDRELVRLADQISSLRQEILQ